jgi:threonine dehydratase
VVLSGGNIDLLVRSTSSARHGALRASCAAKVELRDLPGALAKVTACLAEANANIEEVHHQRAFTHLPVLSAEVEFVLQTRGPQHLAEIMGALERAGFKAEVVPD